MFLYYIAAYYLSCYAVMGICMCTLVLIARTKRLHTLKEALIRIGNTAWLLYLMPVLAPTLVCVIIETGTKDLGRVLREFQLVIGGPPPTDHHA